VRSVGVPEDVWVQGAPIGHRIPLQDAPGVPGREPPAPGVQEDRVGRAVGPGDQ
jgi:hypothetical protein